MSAILSNKPVLLSALGTKFNQLYYSEMNSSVNLVEATFTDANVISLQSTSFGSTSQVNIPIDQFIGNVMLHLRLPATGGNETLCRGWGYAMLQQIGFTLGASNSTTVYLQGDSILQTVLAQCPTEEKRSQIMRLAGEEQLGSIVVPVDEDTPLMDAYVLIPLPFSTACDKLPLDSTMLSNNIVITIAFKANATAIYGGSESHPSAFTVAEILLRQGKLSASEQSIRQEMVAQPDMRYVYPYIQSQSFVSAPFVGVKPSDGFQACSVDFNTFANADLLGIYFWCVADTDKSPTGSNSPRPYKLDEISNLLLTLNGSSLMNMPSKIYKLTGALIGDQQASYFQGSNIRAGTVAPFSSDPADCWMVFFDFSRIRSACVHDELQNVFRLPNQILRLNFNTSKSGYTYRIYATYMYNGAAIFQNGVSSIRID